MLDNSNNPIASEDSPAADILEGMSEAQQAALLEKMLASKTLAKVGSKIVRAASRANAEEAEANKERKEQARLDLGSGYHDRFMALYSDLVADWESLGFETEQLDWTCQGFVQDGNQPGFPAGGINCNTDIGVQGVQSPATFKSDGTVETGKADTRTPDKGIVRAKAAPTHDEASFSV